MLSTPNSITIVDYIKVEDGVYTVLFRTTLADAVYLDMNNNITIQDVLTNNSANNLFHNVDDDTARFALSASRVSNGDLVKVTDSGKMYTVIDNSKLNIEDGYFQYAGVVSTRSYRLYNVSIDKTKWQSVANSTDDSVAQFFYQFEHPSIKATDNVDVDITDINGMHVANEAIVHGIVNEFDGYIRLYSKYVPTENIVCDITVTKF